jgi:hypothetical protein
MTEKERLKMDGNTTKVGSGLWALGSGVGPKAKSLKPKAHPGLKPKAHRGTVLILVVVLMAILAIMGTTFVITSRIERVAAENQVTQTNLNQAFESTLAIIKSTLAEDLWGTIDPIESAKVDTDRTAMKKQNLLGLPCDADGIGYYTGPLGPVKNEPWDAAWTAPSGSKARFYYYDGTTWQAGDADIDGDPWLASPDPLTGQISSVFPGGSGSRNANASGGDNNGDGIIDIADNDSRWAVLPITGANGVTYHVAVRIVDTCGMVNVNTAWRWPRDLAAPTDFLGNTLAGFNLYDATNFGYVFTSGIGLPGRPDDTSVPTPTVQDLINYQDNYILRIESPNWSLLNMFFFPMDLSDELELRHRWQWDNPEVTASIERPQYVHYVQTATGTLTQTVEGFPNLQSTLPNEQARRFLTAYSFSRRVRRESGSAPVDSKFPKMYNLQNTVTDLVGVVKGAETGTPYVIQDAERLKFFVNRIYSAFLADATSANYADGSAFPSTAGIFNDPVSAANYHTWQYIANLVDYLDADNTPTVVDTTATGAVTELSSVLGRGRVNTTLAFDGSTPRVYGLEQHVAITEAALECRFTPGTPNLYEYRVHFELANPWAENLPPPSGVKVEVRVGGTPQPTENVSAAGPLVMAGFGGFVTGVTTYAPPIDDGSGLPSVDLVLISYNANGAPEDVFTATFQTTDLPTTTGATQSFERETTLANWWKSLVNTASLSQAAAGNTLNALNSIPVGSTAPASAYATVNTDSTLADTWCNLPATAADLWETAAGVSFAKLRNLSDLVAVPYVGYVRDPATSQEKGIGDWLKETDNKIHFAFTENTSQKGGIFRDAIVDGFELIGRADDGIDENNSDNDGNDTTGADELDEMRLPGLINVNTAPATVLQALHQYLDPTLGTIAADIENGSNKPYKTVGEVVQKVGSLVPNLSAVPPEDFFVTGVTGNNDVVEKATKWTRFASLTANRSDTFVAYILIEARKDNTTVQSQRAVVLFDRSLCNQPPMKWDGTNNIWIENPAYRLPRVVARQMGE